MRKFAAAVVLTLSLFTFFGCSNAKSIAIPPNAMPAISTQTSVIVIEVQEVPVTRVVEVTRQVEVTRVVTQIITATPEPTPTPTMTSTPVPTSTPAAPSVRTQLLNRLIALRSEVEAITYDTGSIACGPKYSGSIDSHYESIIAYPTYNVAGSSDVIQAAYNNYRQAIGIISTSNRDLYTQCLDWLNKGSPSEFVSSLTWMTARQGVDQALQLIIPAIDLLK
ncbi:MAG: hypothetical protein E4H27_04560 [Anaerolineales bacterium]|nr:MAG: hypothetical protein E4H27_04560 [Anaerolineales bacterium]